MQSKLKSNKVTNIAMANKNKQGGRREGAGRPKGTGKYGEPTTAIRVPTSWATKIQSLLKLKMVNRSAVQLEINDIWEPAKHDSMALPLFTNKIAAGFPSPADDHIESTLDLNEYLVARPAATYYVRVTGESMIGAGIHPDDILIVDRSIEPTDGKIIIASLNGELTVKRLSKQQARVLLLPENDSFAPIEVTSETDFQIWGVVTSVIHQL